MNIIINTSTFSDSHIDNSPKFINNLILNFDVKNNYFVLYPHKTTKPDKKLFPNNITLIPYRYILQIVFQTYQKLDYCLHLSKIN